MSELGKRRLSLEDLDPSSDIDFGNVPQTVWELLVETSDAKSIKNRPRISMSIVNVPLNLTLFELGPRLSSSITEAFYLPMTLNSYRGPILSGMKLPPNLKKLELVETTKSLQTSDVSLPPDLRSLVVAHPLKFSNLDSAKLPPSLQTFRVVGKYNCSLEKMYFPPKIEEIDVGQSTQPVDLLATRARIVGPDAKKASNTASKPRNMVINMVEAMETSTETIQFLREHFPRLDKLHVVLDDKFLTTLGDVWTEVLFEGRVQIRELTVNARELTQGSLSDCGEVFKRSSLLGRKLCRKLVIESEKYSCVSHLNLALALKNIGGISIEISYADSHGPSECFLPRFADLLGLSKTGPRYMSDSFGATPTSLEMLTEKTKLVLVVGDSPWRYETPVKTRPLTVPVSSSALQEVSNVEQSKPRERPIILYTWTQCGFCQKQSNIIEEFKNQSTANKNLFNDKVEVKSLENPADIPDKRVDSFPTWVKDDTLIVGVQTADKLTSLLQ